MINIDKYAYASKLKYIDPMIKFLFSILTLGVCLWANSLFTSIIIILIMGWMTVCKGGTPLALFIKLMLVPMSFLCISVLTIAINVSQNQNVFIFSLAFAGTKIGILQEGFQNASRIFFKALGSVSCLYYLSLSTPMIDVLIVLRRLKVPKLMVEMMGLIYRLIFVLLETVETMLTAQNSRLGYSSISTGYRSLGALVSTIFFRAYKRSDELYTALEARGYEGELNVLEHKFDTPLIKYFLPMALNLILIIATLLFKRFMGGLY